MVQKIFRIFYSTTYTVLFIFLLVLLVITPGDLVRQSIDNSSIQNIIVLASVYLFTAVICLFVYASRLYTNRSVLAAIPKSYVPVEPGEVSKKVRRLIVKNLKQSALIAWDSRPRDVRSELSSQEVAGDSCPSTAERPASVFRNRHVAQFSHIIPVATSAAAWGPIEHPGWSSPSSDDIPNLHFSTVVRELPHLIEAKAVTLAPPDPRYEAASPHDASAGNPPDARVVVLLQRPATMGLRAYLVHLSSMGLINPPMLAADFIAQYEYARFSTSELMETEFRKLMSTFAAILSAMQELDPTIVAELQQQSVTGDDASLSESSTSSFGGISGPRYRTPMLRSEAHSRKAGSRTNSRVRSESTGTVRTAPSRAQRQSSGARSAARTLSTASLGSVRRPMYGADLLPSSSSSSLRSAQSVIRLNLDAGPSELPYRFELGGR